MLIAFEPNAIDGDHMHFITQLPSTLYKGALIREWRKLKWAARVNEVIPCEQRHFGYISKLGIEALQLELSSVY